MYLQKYNSATKAAPEELTIPPRSTDLSLFSRLPVWDDTLLDAKSVNEIFPSLEVEVKYGLVFSNTLFLDFFRPSWFRSIYKYTRK